MKKKKCKEKEITKQVRSVLLRNIRLCRRAECANEIFRVSVSVYKQKHVKSQFISEAKFNILFLYRFLLTSGNKKKSNNEKARKNLLNGLYKEPYNNE